MASQKKVVVRQYDAPPIWGYLPASRIHEGEVLQLLDLGGRVRPIPLKGIKTIAYVHDLNLGDQADPERIGRRTLSRKPRGGGICLRLHFLDGDALECVAIFNAALLDHITDDRCLSVRPPDTNANTYKILIPRSALAEFEVLTAVRSELKRQKQSAERAQQDLFDV